jgi:hypothetical protein
MKRLLLACLAAAAIATTGPAAAEDSVKIGFVGTFTGPAAAIGNDMRDGFNLGIERLDRHMAGRPVEVIYEDDAQKPEVGKQKTDKLIESDHVNFLTGYGFSNVLLASLLRRLTRRPSSSAPTPDRRRSPASNVLPISSRSHGKAIKQRRRPANI